MESHNLWGKNNRQKTIPECIFQLPGAQLALFINRLFATDGWASVLKSGRVQLGYASVNRQLAQQLQHLLLRFGVVASLERRNFPYREETRTVWQLDINHAESIEAFIDRIGIFGKEAAIEKARTTIASRRQTNPQNDIYWDEIVSIAFVGDRQVYDLTIPETHNFIADDICVHNTAICLNVARNVADRYRLPVAIFSLEMSKDQLVQRLLATDSGIESNRLRSGRISQTEWEPLTNALGQLSELPIFIDDTADITVTEMRSKARRLQAEQGKELGLILIDYLQLMQGSGSENRVQEVAQITRGLKALARELRVPLIALSQLSRSVEARNNKRPMMSDLRESGCLCGDTLVTLADSGDRIPIRELVGQTGFRVWTLNETTLELQAAAVTNAFCTGAKPVFEMTTRLGRTIRATANHKFRTFDGWVRLDELTVGERLALPRVIPKPNAQKKMRQNVSRERARNIVGVLECPQVENLANSDLYWDEIVSIEPVGETDVYDLTVPAFQNFIANNIIVHNSIEQDSDLVLMLYRDEYYNSDTPDRGIAEVLITKHRNGPTGTVKLLFDPSITLFRNLAK